MMMLRQLIFFWSVAFLMMGAAWYIDLVYETIKEYAESRRQKRTNAEQKRQQEQRDRYYDIMAIMNDPDYYGD